MIPKIGQRIIVTHCSVLGGLGCAKIESKSCLGKICLVTKKSEEFGEERVGKEFGIKVLGALEDVGCYVIPATDTFILVSSDTEEFE